MTADPESAEMRGVEPVRERRQLEHAALLLERDHVPFWVVESQQLGEYASRFGEESVLILPTPTGASSSPATGSA